MFRILRNKFYAQEYLTPSRAKEAIYFLCYLITERKITYFCAEKIANIFLVNIGIVSNMNSDWTKDKSIKGRIAFHIRLEK